MNTFFIRVGFSKIKECDLIIRVETILNVLTDNERFPSVSTHLARIQTALEIYKDYVTISSTGNRSNTVAKKEARISLQNLLKKLAYHINNSVTDVLDLFHTGFPVSSYPFRPHPEVPHTPNGIKLRDGDHSGTIRMDFIPVKESRSYLYRHGTFVNGKLEWSNVLPTTSSRNNIIKNLSRGTEYHVQVKAINSAGDSDWSNPVTLIAR